jgi:hypothetical protein
LEAGMSGDTQGSCRSGPGCPCGCGWVSVVLLHDVWLAIVLCVLSLLGPDQAVHWIQGTDHKTAL